MTTGIIRDLAFSPDGQTACHRGQHEHGHSLGRRDRGNACASFAGIAAWSRISRSAPTDENSLQRAGIRRSMVWDLATGRETATLQGHMRSVLCVAFSPDGRRLATSSEDQTVRLWDAETGQEVLTLRGHTDIVPSVAFSPDGNRLVSAGADGTVQIREASPRRFDPFTAAPTCSHARGCRESMAGRSELLARQIRYLPNYCLRRTWSPRERDRGNRVGSEFVLGGARGRAWS